VRDQIPERDRLKAQVSIKLPEFSVKIVGGDAPNKRAPDGVVDAQFSVYFTVATALKDGSITLESYKDLKDPELLSLMKNRTLVQDDAIPNGGGAVEISASGKTYSAVVKVPLGEPETGSTTVSYDLNSCFSLERPGRGPS
jgi:2-methylcitrate dehydratase PrpD